MRKTIVVAIREYHASVRSKAFLVTLVAMPILMVGSIAVQLLLKDKVDISDRKVAIVDSNGQIATMLAAASQTRNELEIFTTEDGQRTQIQPKFILENVAPESDDWNQFLFDLSTRVRTKELFAFVIIPSNATKSSSQPGEGAEETPSMKYYSNSPTYRDLSRWLSATVNAEVIRLRFEEAGLDPQVVAKASKTIPTDYLGLVTKDEIGKIILAEKTNQGAEIGVPVGMMMLMLMVVMVGASPLVQSVLEEKMQRIAEVLLGSIPPFQLMMGKLLGTVGVSLTISAVYLSGAFAALSYLGFAKYFPTHLLLWFMAYQALAVFMYGAVFIAVGAAVSDIKESQSMLMPVMILIMAPFFVWTSILKAPSATFSVVVSLIPPATPMLMLLRQGIPPGVPIWQPILGIVGVLLTTVLIVFAAGRIFRVGILMQGTGAKYSEMVRWALWG
jgi:ABC-2 type transport system permease protein